MCCRLCGGTTEDVHHVVNECSSVPRGLNIDVYNTDNEQFAEMATRLIDFDDKLEELENLAA